MIADCKGKHCQLCHRHRQLTWNARHTDRPTNEIWRTNPQTS